MGGVIVRKHIYDAFMNGPDNVIELFHGYTYSGHPLEAAACLGDARHLSRRGVVRACPRTEPVWADAVMSLKGEPNVVDIRTVGTSVPSTWRHARWSGARLRGDGPPLPRIRADGAHPPPAGRDRLRRR